MPATRRKGNAASDAPPGSYPLPPLPRSWATLEPETRTARFEALRAFLDGEAKAHAIYPPAAQVYRALELTPLREVRVLLLGQDPYHGPGQAEGLCFSVPPGVAPPASLRNIFRELQSDLGVPPPPDGSLVAWARRGVLLLNAVLTVRAGEANSHAGKGWEEFTDAVIRRVAARRTRVVFALWGAYAQKKIPLIDTDRHAIVTAAHPSPLSARRGFLGTAPFSRINAALEEGGREAIDWELGSFPPSS
jgi:uracil-DNA glycosylase